MKSGPLLKVSVATTVEAEDAVAELLGDLLGQAASIYHDVESGAVSASVYLPKPSVWSAGRRASLRAGLERIRESGMDTGPGKVAARVVRHEDWAEAWKRHFKPFVVGSALLVKPSWSRRRPRRGQAVVILDPGLSFGTGQHPTTRFCLEQVVERRSRDGARSFLDIGTGSGILAIAAAKVGYHPVEGYDFDPDAVRIARDNALRNGVLRQVRISRKDLTRLPRAGGQRFDLVCANLIDDLLVAEQTRILSRLDPGGTLVLAGILRSQFPKVCRAYEAAGLRLKESRTENEWKSGAFVAG